jgi:hypothetical protein
MTRWDDSAPGSPGDDDWQHAEPPAPFAGDTGQQHDPWQPGPYEGFPGDPAASPYQRPAPAPAPYRDPPPRRAIWLQAAAALLAGIVVAAVAFAVTRHGAGVPGGHVTPAPRAGRAPGAAPPAISTAAAGRVLLTYAAANNQANLARSDTQLARIEAGSSDRLDAGAYRWLRLTDPRGRDYNSFALEHPEFYIPRLPARTYPRWFAVQVTWVATTGPRPGPRGPGYILFTQPAPAAPWKDILEPYGVPGSGPSPAIALDRDGYATALSPGTIAALTTRPARIPAQTAAALNGTGGPVTVRRNLTDLTDESFWTARLPAGSTVTETHQPAGPVYALRAAGGGALLLYAGQARLALAPPSGETFAIRIPGYYSATQTQTMAQVTYAEQFATWDPPPGHGRPHVIADACGIDGRG